MTRTGGLSVYDEFVELLRDRMVRTAREEGAQVQRFKVVKADPLIVSEIGGDTVLEDGDPDVEIARELLDTPPAVGDVVVVHRDADGDWIVGTVIS